MGDNFLNCSIGLLIPFVGTSLGAACVFFMKNNMKEMTTRALTGFAAGVMVAASIWSLLIPAMEQTQSQGMGKMSFFPAFIGFWIGILFLLFLDNAVPHLHMNSSKSEGPKSSLGKTQMMVLAVTIHNIPEGMADYAYGCTGTVYRNSHTEFSRGSDYFNAASCTGREKRKSMLVRYTFRSSRAGGSSFYHTFIKIHSSCDAVSFKLCRGSNDICCD